MGLEYRRLRAPAGSGDALTLPDIAGSVGMLEANKRTLASHSFSINEIPIQTLRKTARNEFLELAAKYSRRYLDVQLPPAVNAGKLFLSGHQPVLFHPGVWFKNFRLDRLAALCGGTAINIQIDNDLCPGKSIDVPSGSIFSPRIERMPFDTSSAPIPFECQRLDDARCFAGFSEQVSRSIRNFVPDPMIGDYWTHVLATAGEFSNPFATIAAGRHRLEKSIGLNTLEVPLSQTCETDSFRHFVACLLKEHVRFRELFNRCLAGFRDLHGIRSRSHPVPGLEQNSAADGPSWTETPFWIWSDSDPRRRRLMVRSVGQSMELAHDGNWTSKISQARLHEGLQVLAESGIRFRPRAVTTTMYLRLVLADFFVHGIGGAKYDQLTDTIVELFFGPPPSSAIVTSTHRLPVGLAPISDADMHHIRHQLRDLSFNPDRHVGRLAGENAALLEVKQELLANIPPQGERRAWLSRIKKINSALQPAVEEQRSQLKEKMVRIRSEMQVSQILGSREFAWPLFPASLIDALQELASH